MPLPKSSRSACAFLSSPLRYCVTAGTRYRTCACGLTDLDKTALVAKLVPIAKAMGSGRGGASMEGELVDSQTGEQIAAVIQSTPGKVLLLGGVSKWGDAELAMDKWARQFRERLDAAHGG